MSVFSPLPEPNTLAALCGAGTRAAADAIGRLVGARSTAVEAAEALSLAALRERFGAGEKVAAVFRVSGGVEGDLLLVLDADHARRLAAALLGGEPLAGDLDERAHGALSEVGNIGASAFLNAVADRLGAACLPSVPRLVFGATAAICRELDPEGGDLLFARAHLGVADAITVRLVIAPTEAAARALAATR